MGNKIKEHFENGKVSIGTFLQLNSSLACEATKIAGLDFFILDTEHSIADIETALECVRAVEGSEVTAFVRINEITRANILRTLDIGVKGLIIPGVKSIEEVKEIIRHGKYLPIGERGFCPTRCCQFGYNDAMKDGIKAYIQSCNEETMIIPQCETKECLEHIDEIVALEGVDGIFVGPFDLSLSLGKPAMFDDEMVIAAFEKIKAACKQVGKPVFIFAPSLMAARQRISEGYDGICYSSDANMLIDSYIDSIKQLSHS